MTYYKIIINSTIVGVCTSRNCFRYQSAHSMLERTSPEQSEYIECGNKLYHDAWMQRVQTNLYSYEVANILTIEEQEYNTLAPISEPIPINDDDTPEEPIIEPVDPVEDITVEYVRNAKLSEISRACRTTIESGFDLELRGETQHFSLTTQDQLNLMSLSAQAQTQDLIPYHADGESCIFYTAEEINEIVVQATSFKNYNIAYYNSLKAYIEALDTIEAVAAITYGTAIPEEYKSDVLKVLEY